MSDTVGEAAARLERAVGRLAEAVARPRSPDGIAPARVAELAGRLDGTLVRLRAALAELDEADPDDAPPAGPGVTEPEETAPPVEDLPAAPQPTPHSDQER